MTTRAKRVLSVDDHAILAEGLEALLAAEPDLQLVGHLSSAEDLVAHVERLEADIVLMDISMPGADPFAAISELRSRCPDVRSIILSAFVRDQYIDAAYAAGAWGYLAKSDEPEAVVEGIRRVLQGELAFTPDVAIRTQSSDSGERPMTMESKLISLTAREREILRLIAQGLSRTEIAEQVSRSPMTIDNHRKSIMKKLGMRDRVELVRYAIAEGLVAGLRRPPKTKVRGVNAAHLDDHLLLRQMIDARAIRIRSRMLGNGYFSPYPEALHVTVA